MSLIYDRYDAAEFWCGSWTNLGQNNATCICINTLAGETVELVQLDIDSDSSSYQWALHTTTASVSINTSHQLYHLNQQNTGTGLSTTVFTNGLATSALTQVTPTVQRRSGHTNRGGVLSGRGIATLRLAPAKVYCLIITNLDASLKNFEWTMLIRKLR